MNRIRCRGRDGSATGQSELKVLRDPALAPIEIPPEGLMLSRALAERLGLRVGDSATVEVQEGKRPILHLPIVRLSEDILGFSATMDIAALNRLLREGDAVNAAALKIDPRQSHLVWPRIQAMPKVEASSVKALWLTLFDETIAGMLMVGAVVLAGFGLLIALGVVYNSARVAFQERAWELASLRILGFTRAEVSIILFSELAFELIVAIPIGLVAGYGLTSMIMSLRLQESFQVPVVIEPASYAIAAGVVLAAAAVSAFVVRRRIEEQRVWVVMDIVSPREAWTSLGDGYRVDVRIIADEMEKATVVPIGALFRRGEAWQAFVVEGGRAHLREVKVSRRSGRLAAVMEGLHPGDTVVVYPSEGLRDGSTVRLP